MPSHPMCLAERLASRIGRRKLPGFPGVTYSRHVYRSTFDGSHTKPKQASIAVLLGCPLTFMLGTIPLIGALPLPFLFVFWAASSLLVYALLRAVQRLDGRNYRRVEIFVYDGGCLSFRLIHKDVTFAGAGSLFNWRIDKIELYDGKNLFLTAQSENHSPRDFPSDALEEVASMDPLRSLLLEEALKDLALAPGAQDTYDEMAWA